MSSSRILAALGDGLIIGVTSLGFHQFILRIAELQSGVCFNEPTDIATTSAISTAIGIVATLYSYNRKIGFFSGHLDKQENTPLLEASHVNYIIPS